MLLADPIQVINLTYLSVLCQPVICQSVCQCLSGYLPICHYIGLAEIFLVLAGPSLLIPSSHIPLVFSVLFKSLRLLNSPFLDLELTGRLGGLMNLAIGHISFKLLCETGNLPPVDLFGWTWNEMGVGILFLVFWRICYDTGNPYIYLHGKNRLFLSEDPSGGHKDTFHWSENVFNFPLLFISENATNFSSHT